MATMSSLATLLKGQDLGGMCHFELGHEKYARLNEEPLLVIARHFKGKRFAEAKLGESLREVSNFSKKVSENIAEKVQQTIAAGLKLRINSTTGKRSMHTALYRIGDTKYVQDEADPFAQETQDTQETSASLDRPLSQNQKRKQAKKQQEEPEQQPAKQVSPQAPPAEQEQLEQQQQTAFKTPEKDAKQQEPSPGGWQARLQRAKTLRLRVKTPETPEQQQQRKQQQQAQQQKQQPAKQQQQQAQQQAQPPSKEQP